MKKYDSKLWNWRGLLVALIALAGIAGFMIVTDVPEENAGKASATEIIENLKGLPGVPTEANTFSATTLINYYECDREVADSLLKGKYIYLKGKVREIGKDGLGTAFATLYSGDPVDKRVVICSFTDPSKLADLNPGRNVLIRGYCHGLSSSVIMKNCVVYDAKAFPHGM